MAALDKVKSYMQFFGWENGGGPGSVKRGYEGGVIANHGDATWIKDMEECCDRVERDAAREELERRGVLATPGKEHTNE